MNWQLLGPLLITTAVAIAGWFVGHALTARRDRAGKRRGRCGGSARGLVALQGLPLLDLTDQVVDLAGALKTSLALPEKAVTDAAHIAIAAVHGMQFLLTWNCTHIANAELFVGIEKACQERRFSCPVICTPEELMGV